MLVAQGSNVALSEVLTWPQALVGAIIVIVSLGLPQILTYLSNRSVKKQVNNNGGSSMKDAVDRIEHKQDEFTDKFSKHIEDAGDRDQRITRLETIIEMKFGGPSGGSTGGPGPSSI